MQHSYESLDRPGGFSRVRLLAPLAYRDYRRLLGGMSVFGLVLVARYLDARQWATSLRAYRVHLPSGMTADDIAINVTGDTVSFAGETTPATDVASDGWIRQERRTGKFQRAFTLPVQIDSNAVTATFTDGVLELVLPKSETVKPKTVKITAGAQK